MVALVTSLALPMNNILVIGLGTGRTATELSLQVLRVEAVELEPKVIAFARKHFGYTGHAVAADGLAYLKRTKKRYDLILLDAFSDRDPVPHLVSKEAIKLMQQRLDANGVLAMQLNQSPGSETGKELMGRLPYTHLYGDGVGEERQNLYLVSSTNRASLNVLDRSRLTVRPVRLPEITDRDYPLLSAAALAKYVSPKQQFPTQGGIGSDGDTSRTLRPLLGGGGFLRSEVRHSPVAVVLEGEARLLALMHPDAPCVTAVRFNCPRVDRRIPWGGVLYELNVTKIRGVLILNRWKRIYARTLRPHLRRAVRVLKGGLPCRGQRALEGYLSSLVGKLPLFGPMVQNLQGYREVARLAASFKKVCPGEKGVADPFRAAVICDGHGQWNEWLNPDLQPLGRALGLCAERLYTKASSSPQARHAGKAAARLLYLLQRRAGKLSTKKLARLRKRIKALKRQFGGKLEPADMVPEPKSTVLKSQPSLRAAANSMDNFRWHPKQVGYSTQAT